MNENGAMVPAEEAEVVAVEPVGGVPMASLNVTWQGQQGDLPDPVAYDLNDDALTLMAQEAIREGGIPGIDADPAADLTDFKVDRFPAKDGLPHRLSIRPKTPFGR